jgi:hypothetical protein
MLSWFKKKKTTSEDTVPVPDVISGEEGYSAEAAETVADISSGLDPSRENVIREFA